MQLQPITDTPSITIGFDAVNNWLYVDWKGEHDQESSQTCCLLMLEALRKFPCAKILNDNSSITRTTVQLTVWGAWWLEEMQRAGLQYVAWVYPRVFEARQATEATVKFIQQPVVATFDDVASAYVWLQKQRNAAG
ncbi:hypothetical protein F0P96_09120 [Hymenobacter busanensis]|uniref:Uncharacterized protein n=1 Tax=Hymenobacter busanensis TaxID=2607656 RepID=A0A7L4ZZ24_9BACT|nr:hypothetical protein [Hymenobacter busanensis]KAA9333131.1 hypothetical protein F0P96_09120 [Hymenobacter busanensis]QHJ08193.1 hypothetical protein GUY19_13200 [Hymenobacter busanensis]